MQDGLVITGLGVVNVLGYGKDRCAEGFLGAAPSPSPIADPDRYHHRSGARTALLVDPAGVKDYLPPARARRMSALSRFAVTASRMALTDAGLSESTPFGRDAAVVMSTAFGASAVTEEILRAIFDKGPSAASPFLFPESVASAPASQIAIDCGARGGNLTLTQRNAGDLLALHRAAALLRAGRARYVLVGSVHQVDPLLHAVLDRFHALARPQGGQPEVGRPFDRDRNGFVLGEGATVLVLERAVTARERQCRPLARLAGSSGAFDATAPARDWGHGERTLATALTGLLRRAGTSTRKVARVVAGACGARQGDRLEAQVLHQVWEDGLPPLIVPKAWCGQFSGGLLAGTVLAASGAAFGRPPGFNTVDPDLGTSLGAVPAIEPGEQLLASSLSAGGSSAWALLERS